MGGAGPWLGYRMWEEPELSAGGRTAWPPVSRPRSAGFGWAPKDGWRGTRAAVLTPAIAPESAGRHRGSRMGESYQIGPFLRVTRVAMVASVSMRPASISILIEAIRAGSAVGAPELSR